jgi:hypothetical protein
MSKREKRSSSATAKQASKTNNGANIADEPPWLSSDMWENAGTDVDRDFAKRLAALKAGSDALNRDREARLKWCYPLDGDLLNQIFELVQAENLDLANPDFSDVLRGEFQLKLAPIVERNRKRYSSDSDYLRRIGEAVVSAEAAVDHVDNVIKSIRELDVGHLETLMRRAVCGCNSAL